MPERGSELKFIAVAESEPGAALRAMFERYWPAYERWFVREGGQRRPSYARSIRALREYMPELVPVYEAICDLVNADDQMARCLSLYRPTPFMTGCSQAIWLREPIALMRNYDYAAQFTEGVNLLSAWTGSRVIAMTDCLWGALDGMNEHGLATALAFGGRKVVGDGFAISLILRYILETCRTTGEAVEVLRRVPSHMAYNVSLIDAAGGHATVQVGPDRPGVVSPTLVCTNHQGTIEWPEHALHTATLQREAYLNDAVNNPAETYAGMLARFLHPPLYLTGQFRTWRTLYTAAYLPQQRVCSYLWPSARWDQTFDNFIEHGRLHLTE